MSFSRRLSAATTALIMALIALFPLALAPAQAIASGKKKPTAPSVVLPGKTDAEKIYALIRLCRPKRSVGFAREAADIFVSESKKHNLPPLLCAAVAYSESHFDQNSGPCVGIMQVHRASLREYTQKRQGDFAGLDPDDWRDNILIGVRELALHHKTRPSHRAVLGRYNGCGPGGSYVDRVLRVYRSLQKGDPGKWRTLMNSGHELWS